MATMLPILAVVVSAILLVLIGRGDPKRRRTARLAGAGQSARTRRLLAAFACAPGFACAMAGDAAAFMIWLGGCAVAGWLVALGFGQAGQDIA